MTASRCSFCNRTVNEVGRIISGPNPACTVHICNECVEVSVGILRDGTGEVDMPKRFKQRPSSYDGLHFIMTFLQSTAEISAIFLAIFLLTYHRFQIDCRCLLGLKARVLWRADPARCSARYTPPSRFGVVGFLQC